MDQSIPIVVPASPEPPKKSPLPAIFLMLIFLSLLSAAGYFYYQNLQLKQQVAKIQTIPNPSSAPIENSSPLNTFDDCGSSQPKTKFSVTLPEGWAIEQKENSELFQQYRISKDEEWVDITCGTGFGGGGCPPENSKTLKIAGQNVSSCIGINPNTKKVGLNLSYLKYGGNTFSFTGSVKTNQTLDLILSTFKFTEVDDWQSYTNSGGLYQVQYPQGWRIAPFSSGEGFGPKEIQEDVAWSINAYDKTETPQDKIISSIGQQFPDRVQNSQTIDINGVKALKVVTTTPSNPEWYSETIIIEYGTANLVISNGAIKDENLVKLPGVPSGTTFSRFYSSFKFMN